MFSWICPQCGRDVPPSKTDCPYCAERAAEAAAALAAQPVAPQTPPPLQAAAEPWTTPQWQPPVQPYVPPPAPPQAYVPPPATYALPPNYAAPAPPPHAWPNQPVGAPWHPPAPRRGLPSWMVGAGVAIGLIGILAAFYMVMQRSGSSGGPSGPVAAAATESATPGKAKVTNPLQKYVEISGLRMITENKEPTAKFVVVNHSGGEIADLAANVTLWASTSRSEEDSIGTFSFKLGSLGPNDSKELSAPLKTKLKMYELPDWQNATAEIQITSPASN